MVITTATHTNRSERRAQAGCLAVNAAFLQDIKDDNRFLDELLLATRDALSGVEPQRLNVRALVELLSRLRDRLAMHFSLEEAFGYCENAVVFPPDLSILADACRHQHQALYLDVCEIVDTAEKLLYHESDRPPSRMIRNLSTAFGRFYRRLNQHDASENDLINAVMLTTKRGGAKC